MKVDLNLYAREFNLDSPKFVRINHNDAIIAQVYQVLLPRQPSRFILKVCPQVEDYFREVFFLKKLYGSLRVPQIISKYDPSDGHFGAVLMQELAGELLKRDDWSDDLAFEIGCALAHIHDHQAEMYGDLANQKALIKSPNQYFNEKFEEELKECRGHLPESLIEKCASYLSKFQTHLANVDGPCLVHRDFRPGNILVYTGKLQGIIDWSGARAGFAEQDFCSLEHFQWIPSMEYKKVFLKGYSSIRPVPNYERLMPLLQVGRALAVIGYTVKSDTWNNRNASLYAFNRDFLEKFKW